MDTLARLSLEAAKTRSGQLCNTTPRISHWIDGHSALATTSDAGYLSLLYWQARPFQRIPLFDGIASRNRITTGHRAMLPDRLPVLQRPCA